MRQRIRDARRSRGMTQEEVADLAGLALRHYQRFETLTPVTGERDFNPKIKTLKAICEAVRLPLSKLVDEPTTEELKQVKL
jgi:transcriptional regulator with XRE-family HTH domain